jgi:16S rRNA A1518/A1519 N6-dimethyltransferase RsmA/KsgA/DIM1 with predicted DNA glycosylase/AP lyase activity
MDCATCAAVSLGQCRVCRSLRDPGACAGDRVYERQILRELFAAYPATSHVVDWGAGSGDLTSLLVEHFHHVYAVEPHPGMRAVLATRWPLVQIVDGTIMSAVLPTTVEVGLISHVFYHVPDYEWGAYTIHAASNSPRTAS